jgi:DNA repair exonuclease SbcCD ATPase subunit
MLSQSYTQRANRLGMAHDKANQYWQACQLLDQWLQQADSQLEQIGLDITNPQAIRNAIDQLQALRSVLNTRSLERDELGRMANELCANSQPQQVAAIRTPLHSIGEHFNRLYALIGERQHRLERALLDLGQFEQVREFLGMIDFNYF